MTENAQDTNTDIPVILDENDPAIVELADAGDEQTDGGKSV